ncbi:MAG: FG-GAP-like repeat-containing protein [Bacteroidota bacterium]
MKKTKQNSILSFILFMVFHGAAAQVVFTEKAATKGIDHFHLSTDLIGAGLAVFDYNNDGWEDIWMNGGNQRDVLYANNGDGTFTEVGFQAGLLITAGYHTKGIVTGDINNDGWRDVFLSTRGGNTNLLLLNNGDGTFISITTFAGVDEGTEWSGAATMADFNSDGWLDIYVGNYIESNDFLFDSTGNSIIGYAHTCFANKLYLNNGDLTFTDVSQGSGTADEGCALATMATDFNSDGEVDLLVANDFGEWVLPNAALENNSGVFINNNQMNGMDSELYAMGIASGDIDQDNDPDYYFTNLGRNLLLENDGGNFMDVTASAGVEDTQAENGLTVGWGTALLDVDNDTDLDLFVANGFISALSFNQTSVPNPDKLFLNNAFPIGEKMQFTDATEAAGLGDEGFARGMVHADFDKDGDQDLVVLQASGTANPDLAFRTLFYENESANENNWLQVKLEGTISNKDAFGSKMRVVLNDRSWTHEVVSGSSHASQSTSIAHLGLGDAGQVDSLVVEWPMGGKQILTDIAANQFLHVREDTAMFTDVTAVLDGNELIATVAPNPCKDQTTVYISNQKQIKLTLELIRLDGTIINTWTTNGERLGIDTSRLPAGLYVLKIIAENKLINTLKLKVFQ